MEFPTIDKFAKDVAEKALDEITYEGKTIREWAEILVKQQPCENCVKREDVKSGMIKYGFLAPDMTVTEFVEDLPSVPQPKTGHWIKVTNGRGGHECDLCHEYAPSYQSGDEYLTKYCPNCGVKMEVEE